MNRPQRPEAKAGFETSAGLSPRGESGYFDRSEYRAVHFYGDRLVVPLGAAAQYLQDLEDVTGRPPHTLCIRDDFSSEDAGGEMAWRVTLVVGVPVAGM